MEEIRKIAFSNQGGVNFFLIFRFLQHKIKRMCSDDILEIECKHSYVKETDDNKHDWRDNGTNREIAVVLSQKPGVGRNLLLKWKASTDRRRQLAIGNLGKCSKRLLRLDRVTIRVNFLPCLGIFDVKQIIWLIKITRTQMDMHWYGRFRTFA